MPLGLGRKILKQSGENVESCLVKITFTHFYGILRKLRSVFCWLIDPGWTNECCYCHHNYITAQSLTQNPIYAHALNVVWLNNSWGCYLKRLQHRRSVCCLLHQINLMFLLYWAFFFIFILCLNVSYIELFLLHKKKAANRIPFISASGPPWLHIILQLLRLFSCAKIIWYCYNNDMWLIVVSRCSFLFVFPQLLFGVVRIRGKIQLKIVR